jgi:hypothetical protein
VLKTQVQIAQQVLLAIRCLDELVRHGAGRQQARTRRSGPRLMTSIMGAESAPQGHGNTPSQTLAAVLLTRCPRALLSGRGDHGVAARDPPRVCVLVWVPGGVIQTTVAVSAITAFGRRPVTYELVKADGRGRGPCGLREERVHSTCSPDSSAR